jgi:polyisoprenoid-binding protein YceI
MAGGTKMAQEAMEFRRDQYPPAGKWEFDQAHTNAGFVARHMLTKVRGRFTELTGSVEIGEGLEDSSVQVEIQAASIDSNQDMRDNHLRSPDFLDVEKFPVLSFRSTALRPVSDTEFELDGELTIKDVTRPITLKAELLGWGPGMQEGQTVASFTAKTTIDREDWDMTWNMVVETGGWLVSKKVDLEIDAELQYVG